MLHILGQQSSLLNQYLRELRDTTVQQDRMRFRRNLERMGEIMAYEMSKEMLSEQVVVPTPLGESNMEVPGEKIVLGTILRAGLPFHQGFLNYFDGAENAMVSAYRKHTADDAFEISIEYLSSPSLEGKTLILTDPMLATGRSMVLAWEAMIRERGLPAKTYIAAVIGSQEGVDFARKHLPSMRISLWLGAVDPELNAKSYIVPGLGDAGDLAFGPKL
jgi:uracil phosphoribosyltransferase